MMKWLDRFYQKSEFYFALVWIGVYCAANSLANPLSKMIGVGSSASLLWNLALTVLLLTWIRKNGLTKYYGLCPSNIPARRFLWYVPLVLFMSRNLWFGFAINFPAADTACYILSMLCVGFWKK